MIQFLCSGCNAQLRISDKESGKLGRCPYCGANSRIPGYPRRTSRLKILFKISIVPLGVALFWICFLSLSGDSEVIRGAWIGGLGTLFGLLFFLWAFSNFMTWLTTPREYWLMRKGGGDPWFDSLPPPFNNDPPEVRYQELYEEKLRQENAQHLQPLLPPRHQ